MTWAVRWLGAGVVMLIAYLRHEHPPHGWVLPTAVLLLWPLFLPWAAVKLVSAARKHRAWRRRMAWSLDAASYDARPAERRVPRGQP